MAKANSPTKLCGEAGCGRPLRARGLCIHHYNAVYRKPNPKEMVRCGWCGTECSKERGHAERYRSSFCSYDCRDNMRVYLIDQAHPRLVSHVTKWHPAHPSYRRPVPVVWQPPPRRLDRPRAPRIFVAGSCVRCGRPFVAEDYTNTAKVCSHRCAKGLGRDRRRARQRDAYVEDVWRERIFRRDGYRCQLCQRKVRRDKVVPHPLAPTLDHIIPLAAGVEAGGVHAPHNVQCAHYRCNVRKQASMAASVQLVLFG